MVELLYQEHYYGSSRHPTEYLLHELDFFFCSFCLLLMPSPSKGVRGFLFYFFALGFSISQLRKPMGGVDTGHRSRI
jgi:hypothetical protein